MSWIIASYALLFAGVFTFQVAAAQDDDDDPATPPPATPGRSPLYDADDYDAEVDGTEAGDTLTGTDGTSTGWFLGAGNDSLTGSDESDFVDAGTGDDTLAAREGNDIVLGGAGNDSIDAGIGFDTVQGDAGDDSLAGNGGNDTVSGGVGNDTVLGGSGADAVYGDDGDDYLGGLGFGLSTSTGDLVVDGLDSLYGGAGNDTLLTGPGDVATGGAGADLFALDQQGGNFDLISRIADFQTGDRVEIVYTPARDAGGNPVPGVVTVRPNAEGTAGIITLDGEDIAEVTGGQALTVADLVLRAVTG